MNSEHQVLFSSLSESKKCNSILEIGTYDGTNAFILSQLFPDSKITTMDLPKNDNNFVNFYGRDNIDVLNKLCEKRDNLISKSKNIIFKELNSINLTFSEEKYDLIWIDGAHGYPCVSIDITNSLNLLNKNGHILCDDIFLNKINSPDNIYHSNAALETLQEFKKENLINFDLIYKRLSKKFNAVPKERAYIAVIN